jgi:putative ABC transport system permease protein
MDPFLQDIRYAARRLARSPGFTAIVAFVLALGIGGTAITFGVVDAVLLRPLAFPRSNELVRVFSTWERGQTSASPLDFRDWRAMNRSFTELAALNEGYFALTNEGPAEQISGSEVTGGFFNVMGVQPLLGHALTPANDAFDGPKVALLSYTLWRRRFGGDSTIVGRSVRLDGLTYAILGVMPAGFDYPGGSELWLPLRFSAEELSTQRGSHYLDVVGRLKPGVTIEAADRDIRRIAANLSLAYPRTNAHSSASVTSLRDALVGEVRAPLLILLVAVGVVLLIACSNVAGLLVVRGIGREREIAIRTALGAGRGRLMRGLLIESLALAVLGGLGGTLLAVWGSDVVARMHAVTIPLLGETRVDPGVLAFTGGITLLTALLFGLLPAWQAATSGGLAARLHMEGRGTTGSRLRTRNALVVAQTALAVLLLVGAGLLVRSFVRLQGVDPGFDSRHVLTFGVSLPDASFPKPEQSALFYEQLTERLAAIPGVTSAGAVFGLPLTEFGYSISAYELDGRKLSQEEQDALSVQIRVVTPDYFRAMGIPIRQGRGIAPSDRRGTPPVIVVNETAARRIWPGQDPLGHRLLVGTRLGMGGDRAGGEVVGVIGDLHERSLALPGRPTMFLAHAQFPTSFMGVAIRTTGDPLALSQAAHAALTATDPNVPLFRLRSMQQLVDANIAKPRAYTVLLGVFALVAITLAGVGLYGVLSQSVAQRGRELGVRMALGASAHDVVALVLRQGVRLAAAGVTLGLVAAIAATRAMQSLLFGVRAQDPTTFAAVGCGLFVLVLLASLLPARRATRMDPMDALRTE